MTHGRRGKSELIALIRLLDLRVDPGFCRGFRFRPRQHSFKYAAAINRYFVSVRGQHQVHLRFDFLISENVNIDGLGPSQGNDLFVLTEGDSSRWTDTGAHGFQTFR